MKFILDGIPSFVKESVGEYSSAKDLWLKLEKDYQGRRQDTKKNKEVKPTKDAKQEVMQDSIINEGKNPPKSFNCCNPKYDDEEDLSELKDEIIATLEELGMGPEYYSSIEVDKDAFNNLESRVMDVIEKLENYQKENGVLKQQIKKYEKSKEAEKVMSELKLQLEQKKNEIKKLKTEVSDQLEETKKLHDQLNKSFEDLEETREINVILKTQFEEAKRT